MVHLSALTEQSYIKGIVHPKKKHLSGWVNDDTPLKQHTLTALVLSTYNQQQLGW